MESRIIDLETRIAYQDKLIADLDDVVRSLARRIDSLDGQLAQFRENMAAPEIGPANDPPPHY